MIRNQIRTARLINHGPLDEPPDIGPEARPRMLFFLT